MSMNDQKASQRHYSADGRFEIIECPEGRVIIDTESYSYLHACELLAPIMRGAMAHALANMAIQSAAS